MCPRAGSCSSPGAPTVPTKFTRVEAEDIGDRAEADSAAMACGDDIARLTAGGGLRTLSLP
jgi:hypothetical protein